MNRCPISYDALPDRATYSRQKFEVAESERFDRGRDQVLPIFLAWIAGTIIGALASPLTWEEGL